MFNNAVSHMPLLLLRSYGSKRCYHLFGRCYILNISRFVSDVSAMDFCCDLTCRAALLNRCVGVPEEQISCPLFLLPGAHAGCHSRRMWISHNMFRNCRTIPTALIGLLTRKLNICPFYGCACITGAYVIRRSRIIVFQGMRSKCRNSI